MTRVHTAEVNPVGFIDCSDVVTAGFISSGVYTLLSNAASHPLSAKDVYCDMETAGGG